jgi:hypothetical protein
MTHKLLHSAVVGVKRVTGFIKTHGIGNVKAK